MSSQLRPIITSLANLALPMAITTLIEASVGFINIAMLGHLGVNALASGALVTNFFTVIIMIMWGIFSACNILVANRYGANDKVGVSKVVCSGSVLAIILGLLMGILLWRADILLAAFGQSAQTIHLATGYFHGLAIAGVADLFTFLLFNFFEGILRPKIALMLSICYVPLNIFANYVLVFGKFHFPEMQVAGIGYGTAIAFWILTILCLATIFFNKNLRAYFTDGLHFEWQTIIEILKLGLPQGLFWALNFIFFFVVALLMGRISEIDLASFQITMQWYNLFFIITYCLGNAASIKTSEALGQAQQKVATYLLTIENAGRLINLVPVGLGVIFFIFFPHWLTAIDVAGDTYHKTPMLIDTTALFFIFLSIFYLFSTNRYLSSRTLMGLKDSWFIFLSGVTTWFVIAIPLCFWLNHLYPKNTHYLWYVMIFSEVIMLLSLLIRTRILMKKYV